MATLEVETVDGVPVLKKYSDAIGNIESAGSGGYDAIGPRTRKGNRAYGKHQVMDFNIGPWTQEVLGVRMTPQQFLADPKAQETVFAKKFGEYVTKYGNADDAASAWFTGRPMASGASSRDILGTSGAGYVNKFRAALGQPFSPSGQSADVPVAASPSPERRATGAVAKALLNSPFSANDLETPEDAPLPENTASPFNLSNTRGAQSTVEGAGLSTSTIRAVAEKYGLSYTQAANYLKGLA